MLLAKLEEEARGPDGISLAAEYIRRYLEIEPEGTESQVAWERLANLYRLTGNVMGACGAFVRAFDARDAPFSEISNMANWLNNHLEEIASMDAADKASVFGSLARLMESRIAEASATDHSRLAWLHLHAGDKDRALQVAELGLKQDPENMYCERLVEKLTS